MILGITGSFGAGKGAVVEYLVQSRRFRHFSVSGFITEEVVHRCMPVDRDSMTLVANDLRATHGPAYFVDSLYARAKEASGDVVIESLRAVAEVRRIRELGGFVLGVDAAPEVRYERVVNRGSEKDQVSVEKWLQQEQAEMNLDDDTKQNIFGALNESNMVIENNGSLEELHARVDEVLTKLN